MLWGVQVETSNMGSLSGKGINVCEEIRKRMFDVCCLQELRWRGQASRILGIEGRYKLWWSGTADGVGGEGVMV